MEAYFGENTSNPLNNLNEAGHKKVEAYISLLEGFNNGKYLKDRSTTYGSEEKESATIVDFTIMSKLIRIYDTRVSAGNGNFLDGGGYDEVNRIEYNVPDGADFGVQIS